MELQAYEIMSRATGKPGTKAKLARALGLPTNAVSRRCCAPERIDNPCGTGRTNEVERLETILKGLVTIGQPQDADFIVTHLRRFVRECKQESGPEHADSLPLILMALEMLVRALRHRMDNRPKDFEEIAVRAVGLIEDSVTGRG